MAGKSFTVTATFIHSTTLLLTVLLVQILLFSFVRSDQAVCDNFCPPVGFVDGWETRCNRQQSSANCGDSVVSDVPSAPSKLKVTDFIHEIQDTRLLALNITWVLPVTGNFTGLQGFYVDVLKTNYPVGRHECNEIRFDHPLTVSSFASEIVFQFSCVRDIKVDSYYRIEITSIGSMKSITTLNEYHTSSCAIVPGVGRCPLVNVLAGDWKPSQKPTTIVVENSVTVVFSTYPGDRWITYKINLRPCNGDPTPEALSRHVNTDGAVGRYSFSFNDVPSGCYVAHVSLYQKKDGSIVDGYSVPSEPFNVSQVSVRPTEEPTNSPRTDNYIVVSTPSQKPDEGLTTPVDVSESTVAPENNQDTEPVSKTFLDKGIIGAGVGIAVALLLLVLTFVVKKRRRSDRQSEIVSPQETPRACLVDNMLQNDLTVPGYCDANGHGDSAVTGPGYCDVYGHGDSAVTGPGYCDVYGHGDSVSVFRSECSQCCDHAYFLEHPEEFKSVTNMSGVTV